MSTHWSDIKTVPGWFGTENQGAGIVLADISGSGRLDLIIFHIDNPGGENHGHYRIGWSLDASGNVTGGWSDIKAVPGWFGAESQGAGIALADISGNGQPDLIVFHLDNPGGENHGHYRIGWNLDASGNVTGGWSEIKAVSGWFGAESQGAGIALADISRNGRPDLIVFHIDNPGGENHGHYRIGWNLDASGNVTGGWSEVKAVPGWFGAEDQGADIAIVTVAGARHLIIFHVDNPGGENHGHYRIGWNLDASGDITGGWSEVRPVPGWFGAENQGAGIAVADIVGDGHAGLFVFHVDNLGGENHGHYRFCKDILLENAEVLAVHAALLHTGKVLYFSGDQHDPENNRAGRVDATRLWDISSFAIHKIGSPRHDLFCSGHAFLADGRLIVAGGTQEWSDVLGDPHGHGQFGHFRGLRDATIFNANTNTWNATVPMILQRGRAEGGGRWYPTLLTLPDGRVFAMSGHPERTDTRHNNITLEVFDAALPHQWSDYGDKPDAPDSYPRLHLLPSGEVLCVTPMSGNTQRLRLGSTWSAVKPVADWFGAEGQGADIVIADISGDGRPDLIIFHIDNPGGENHGYYRIGWDLDADGNVTGGWSDVKAVPGWFGAENQGAGIAIADLSGNGRPDLIVFHIDNPGGENHGHYRIGWNLDTDGNVMGGWSDIKAVPGWFGAENQGAGIVIADLSGSGRPDLIVFHIDNPGGENHGYYRIGWNLDTGGNVTGGWSNIKAVPGWFGAENQGAGIALADISGNGRPDLIVFHIDNPGGENHGHYRIGWNLDAGGNVAGGWSNIKAVPGWFGAENQGAGIALADLSGNGRPDLIVFHIDNPGGENHGYYQVGLDVDINGDFLPGHWTTVAGPGYDDQGIWWTSVLLPLEPPDYRTRVLIAGGQNGRLLDLGNRGVNVSEWRDTSVRNVPEVRGRHGSNPVRQHCNAVILPDGKILVVGGTTDGTDAHAVLTVELYDPARDAWTTLGNLSCPRVYHSVALLLPDGRVWIGGSDHDGAAGMAARELTIELFSPPYLSLTSRPIVSAAPSSIGYATRFEIVTPQATQQKLSIALVRCGSVTHAFNPDQRYVRLEIISAAGRVVTVASPPDANVAPPGYYLLFIVDELGAPSVGWFLQVA
ncbi:galactose oxidase-like domain-containing protein [Nitrosomonas communis]|uniref:galactose oxidase-like domain-containing protein n=1 Tax=Nitrosomonas communis TaxID=44574 RepID=UPI0026ED97CC|nr:galactose oxidase-like domain-containing protein [Nitrosomonas communis]MCO6428231.1 DUF1929 domain-containing protein [Nitrosomonas communis]